MKGVSQVLTAAILIAVSLSVAGVYSQWSVDFSEDMAGSAAESIGSEMTCGNAEFRTEGVEYSVSGQKVFLDLVNTGTIVFDEDLTIYVLRESEIVGQERIGRLDVDETRNTELNADEPPEQIVVLSSQCPELEVSQNIELDPEVAFTLEPSTGNVETEFEFNASDSKALQGQIEEYRWDFGDGSTGAGETLTHSYDDEGEYTVELEVEDTNGNIDTETRNVQVD